MVLHFYPNRTPVASRRGHVVLRLGRMPSPLPGREKIVGVGGRTG
jgi:hypothetical protein